MKHLKSSVILRTKKIPKWKLKLFLILFLTFILPDVSYGQLQELSRELQKDQGDFEKIADIVISAVKTIAAVSVIIGALVFLYLREQQNDLTKKVGQVIIGIIIFWILLSVGDSIRS